MHRGQVDVPVISFLMYVEKGSNVPFKLLSKETRLELHLIVNAVSKRIYIKHIVQITYPAMPCIRIC